MLICYGMLFRAGAGGVVLWSEGKPLAVVALGQGVVSFSC